LCRGYNSQHFCGSYTSWTGSSFRWYKQLFKNIIQPHVSRRSSRKEEKEKWRGRAKMQSCMKMKRSSQIRPRYSALVV
ncbi:unnamed protein product, partial [Heterosigma akashiwo]